MKKIEELTDQQINLMETVAKEYEQFTLSGDDSYDIKEIRRGIDFIYGLTELKSPEIVVCSNPVDMAIQAGLKKGETIDSFGCGYDSGWTAWADFMQRIGVDYEKEWYFDTWRDLINKSGIFATVLCENVALVCIRPSEVHRNELGDLHNTRGAAIKWRDGYGEYFLNGVAVDEAIVVTPAEKLDPKIILKEQNAEVRRELVRKIGIERIVLNLGAKSLDKQDEYELLLLELGDGRSRPYLKMRNPSISTWHLEGVPPDTKTVKEALAWRNKTEEVPEVLT